MKYTLLLLCALAFTVSKAQRSGMNEDFEISYDSMDQVKVELNLSEDQLAKWSEVNEKYYPKLQALEKIDSLENRQRLMRVRRILQDRDAELKEFIFAAQWDKYQTLQRQEQRKRMKLRRQEMMMKRKQRLQEEKKEDDGGLDDR
ncbi:hypothetical protein [Ekhidna sp.]|jgi:hypothetical protein|uniref:hypothetical protein n=1 Tax=Ekhidna sp. TaxID=2608089 RepID=UPI0032EE5D96